MAFLRLSTEKERLFLKLLHEVVDTSRMKESLDFIQHGTTSVYCHSVAVAYLSCVLAERLNVNVHWDELIRGALLHDYFLYDWHVKDDAHRLHGFRHPGFALSNAMSDFKLTGREANIILRHMFPLTPIPPASREAWLVCMADKICGSLETLGLTKAAYGRAGGRRHPA